MYDKKSAYPDKKENELLEEVKREYGGDFEATIKGWGGDRMPKRTIKKLGSLARELELPIGATIS